MRRRRKIRGRKLRNQKKMLFIGLLFLVCVLTVGYAAFQTVISINVKGSIKVDERCVIGNVFNFEQKNESQEFKAPCSGTYRLEVWGAQGGDSSSSQRVYDGGYGGYSTANITLKVKQKLYITVGSKGESATDLYNIYNLAGGYNGGGLGGKNGLSVNESTWAGGGGATHISYIPGLLSSLENQPEQLLIVGAGGGGAGSFISNGNVGGCGGGYIGCSGTGTAPYATGGTQNAGGTSHNASYHIDATFGKGASVNEDLFKKFWSSAGSGGGGGYYGGGLGYTGYSSAGGGSSYIGNQYLTSKAMYCYDCDESLDLTKPEIFTVSTTGNSNYKDTVNCTDGYSANPISKCAKKGNGHARITLISKK